MTLPLFIGISFILTFLIGRLLERIHIPWLFGAMVVGLGLAAYNPIPEVTTSDTFSFLAELGMYFLLFMVGFEMNLKKIKSHGSKIVGASIIIILFEALLGSLFIYFVMDLSWFISIILALSFATVGEAVLVPILDTFKLLKTKLGEYIIGIGSADDIFEILVLIIVTTFVSGHLEANTYIILGALVLLFLLTYVFSALHPVAERFAFTDHFETLFFTSIGLFFIFIGIGAFADASALAALLAGVALKSFLPTSRREAIDSEVRVISYGMFAPLFFLWIGTSIDLGVFASAPVIIAAFVILSALAKLFGSLVVTKRELGTKKAFLLGVGLSVRFSTGIVIAKILFDNNLIDSDIYSILIAASIVLTLLVPIVFAQLVRMSNLQHT